MGDQTVLYCAVLYCTVLYCCCRPFFQLVGDLTELNEKVYSDTEVQNPDQQLEEQVGEESTFLFFLVTN